MDNREKTEDTAEANEAEGEAETEGEEEGEGKGKKKKGKGKKNEKEKSGYDILRWMLRTIHMYLLKSNFGMKR